MALSDGSLEIECTLKVNNPKCSPSELAPWIDQALARAKAKLISSISMDAGGGQCQPHDKETFDKSRCP